MTKYIKCGGGGLPPQVITDMNAVLNKKFGTSTDYPSSLWPSNIEKMTALPEESASGSIAHFTDGADTVPLKTAVFNFTPTQAQGTPTPSNPIPIYGHTGLNIYKAKNNLLDGTRAKNYAIDTFSTSTSGTNDTGDYYTLQAGNVINNQNLFPWLKFNANTQYTLILKIGKNNTATSTNIRVVYTDGTGESLTRTGTSEDPETTEILVFTTNANKSVKEIDGYYQSGKTYLYYGNIGIFSGVVTAQDFEAYNGTTYPISWSDTVYGGYVNEKGEVWATRAKDTFDGDSITSLNTSGSVPYARVVASSLSTGERSKMISNQYVSSATAQSGNIIWVSASQQVVYIYDDRFTDLETAKTLLNTNPVDLVYPLATPVKIATIDPIVINSALGVNNVWNDGGGDTSLTYRADIDLYVAEHS